MAKHKKKSEPAGPTEIETAEEAQGKGAVATSLEEKIARLAEVRPDLAEDLPEDVTEAEVDGLLIEATGKLPPNVEEQLAKVREPLPEMPPSTPAAKRTFTAADLRKRGYVDHEKEYEDGTVVIVTKGFQKLRFPGDEEKAGAMSQHQLDGVPPVDTTPKTFLGRPKMTADEKRVKA